MKTSLKIIYIYQLVNTSKAKCGVCVCVIPSGGLQKYFTYEGRTTPAVSLTEWIICCTGKGQLICWMYSLVACDRATLFQSPDHNALKCEQMAVLSS